MVYFYADDQGSKNFDRLSAKLGWRNCVKIKADVVDSCLWQRIGETKASASLGIQFHLEDLSHILLKRFPEFGYNLKEGDVFSYSHFDKRFPPSLKRADFSDRCVGWEAMPKSACAVRDPIFNRILEKIRASKPKKEHEQHTKRKESHSPVCLAGA